MLKNNYTGLVENKTEGDDFDPYGFGLSRTHELPLALQWLYENYPRNNSEIIWETMELMFQGGKVGGRDWTTFFVEGVFPSRGTPYIKTSGFTHGVNLAEGIEPRGPSKFHRYLMYSSNRFTLSHSPLPHDAKPVSANSNFQCCQLDISLPLIKSRQYYRR